MGASRHVPICRGRPLRVPRPVTLKQAHMSCTVRRFLQERHRLAASLHSWPPVLRFGRVKYPASLEWAFVSRVASDGFEPPTFGVEVRCSIR